MRIRVNQRVLTMSSPITMFLLLMPYFEPNSLEYIAPSLDSLFEIWKILSTIIVFGLYIFYYHRLSKLVLALAAFQLMCLFSTVINGGDFWKLAVSCGTILGFSMLTEMYIKRSCKRFISVAFHIFFALILINLLLLLVFPAGLRSTGSRVNFLGIDNALALSAMVPMMGVACIFSAFKNKKLTSSAAVMLVMISASVLITWSATGVVAWFIMLAYILFAYRGRRAKYFNPYALFSAFVALQIIIVFLHLQEYFAFIIENILGKSVSFTGRIQIWDFYFANFLKSPIIGNGVYEGRGLYSVSNKSLSAHNAVLQILNQSGVIGLALFAIPFIMAAVRLYKNRDHFLSGIVTVTLFAFLMIFLTEAQISSVWVFGFLEMAICIPDIIKQYESRTISFYKRGD